MTHEGMLRAMAEPYDGMPSAEHRRAALLAGADAIDVIGRYLRDVLDAPAPLDGNVIDAYWIELRRIWARNQPLKDRP